MLNFKNISLRRASKVLLTNSSFTLHKGEKVGFTGANGAGKSSFFALIRGELALDEGDFSMPPNLEIAHVDQETPAVHCTAIDYVMDGDVELRYLQTQLNAAENNHDGIKLAELHNTFEIIGGYTAAMRAARLLNGLGFSAAQEQKAVSEFSGGWRMRLNLAQALMCRSDILMLDEPTNHLDLDAVIWLQEWLKQYAGTLLLISHDRDFLDTIATHIVHIEQQKAQLYTGNYSAFEKMRAEKLAQMQSAFVKQQREREHIQHFINRFKAQATKAKQAQSRIKALERMELISQAHIDSPFNFKFAKPHKLPNPLITLDKVSLGYDTKILLTNIGLSISPADRIGLLGHNGAGKSTLIKALAGELNILNGERREAEYLKIGYFNQHQLEQLHLDQTPLWHCQQIDKHASEKELRNFLGGFDFQGDKVLEAVRPFSGGEKARLVLALLVLSNPNLLLLDEPTNHLDLEMRHALSMALQEYQGAMLVISHDRHLLRSVTDQLLLVANGKVQAFDGDLDDYKNWLAEQKKTDNSLNNRVIETNTSVSRKDQRKLDAERRKQHKPLFDALKKAEGALEKATIEKRLIEQQLTADDIYNDSEKMRLKQLLARRVLVDKALEEAELTWLEAQERIDALTL